MRPSSIVVGAGAGGLVAALYLQRAGHDVMVLEAKARVGGCASSFPAQGFTFLAGATTLVGLEPGMPLGKVLGELDVDFTAPRAPRNIAVHQAGKAVVLTTDAPSNREQLEARYGVRLSRFFERAVSTGARGWDVVTALHVPPRGLPDLARAASSAPAWRLVPALLRSTAAVLGDVPGEVRRFVDELLLVSTQASSAEVPYLFGSLGMEYLQRPMYLPQGGLPALLGRLADVFVARGGRLALETPATAVRRRGRGLEVSSAAGVHPAQHVVLNLTHWDALRLVDGPAGLEPLVRRHPDAWGTFTLYLGVEDTFPPATAPYTQIILERPLAATGASSLFVTLSRADDRTLAPAGHRSITVSCHTPAAAWAALDDDALAARREQATAEVLAALRDVFGALRVVVSLPGTPRTWQGFTGRHGGRVGGLPFTFATLARGFPTGRTPVPGLVRVGDTIFPGQSVPACAWSARRVVGELLSSGPSRERG